MINTKKSIGIDLLRIIATLMIIILHILGQGGVIKSAAPDSLSYYIAWFLETMCIGAVNWYILISGYVNVRKKFKISKIIFLWTQVFFYSFFIPLAFFFFSPGSLELKGLIRYLFPIITNQYWYFTCYFALFFLMPGINLVCTKLTHRQIKFVMVISTIGFVILPMIARADLFGTASGYSLIWLVYLYTVGACLNLLNIDFKYNNAWNLVLYFVFVILAFTGKVWADLFGTTLVSGHYFIAYTSILVVMMSIFLFLFFNNLNLKKSLIISKLSGSSFGVYLIHTEFLVFELLLLDYFVNFASFKWYQLICLVLASSVLIYLICYIIEYTRKRIFEILKIQKFSELMGNKIHKYLDSK